MITIDQPEDPRLAPYCGMTEAALRRAIDIEHGVFVVEGARAIRQLIHAGWPLRSVLLRTEKVEAMSDVVTVAERGGAPVYIAGQAVFDQVAGFPVHRGVLALADRPAEVDPGQLISRSRVLLVVEGVNDHENLGALFRNAATLGADAVLLDPSTCDPLYRRSVRVSVGHVLRVPFARLTPWPGALRLVTDSDYDLVALSPTADATLEDLASLGRLPSASARLALLVGAEGPGLSDGALQAATHVVRIPMAGGADSLNVATAAAIALHRLVPLDRPPAREPAREPRPGPPA
jgi:tRNA G18 (ribose-2'-O)-methylase SpoU